MAFLQGVASARAMENRSGSPSRYVVGYTEAGPLAAFGLRWFALVETEDEPPLVVWTRSHEDARKVLRAAASAASRSGS